MKAQKKVALICLGTFLITITALATGFQGRVGNNEKNAGKREHPFLDSYPKTEIDSKEPTDPQERTLWNARNKRHNSQGLSDTDAKLFRIKEDTNPISLGAPSSHAPVEPALPVRQSDAIIIVEITKAQAYLSEDKTSVYSEFTAKAENVLKANPLIPVTAGSLITAERFGGKVQLPSGQVIVRGILGKGMPQTGRRYLLFLAGNVGVQTYSIITGYELRGGQIFPLDGNAKLKEGHSIPQYTGYDRYQGVSEDFFLKEVEETIVRSERAPSGAEGER